jgi:preprotein translocase subunit SecA
MYPTAIAVEDVDPDAVERESLIVELREDVVRAYEEREQELGSGLMRALERYTLLQIIDDRWREHLHDMDYLREGIHLRGFAQIDPLVAYKNEAYEMFRGLMNTIWEEFGRFLFHVDVQVESDNGDAPAPPTGQTWTPTSSSSSTSSLSYSGGTAADQPSALAAARQAGPVGDRADAMAQNGDGYVDGAVEEAVSVPAVQTRRVDESERVGRNDPCWCGSGRKFKKCHGA